jgi:hypothetical protein
MDGSADDLLDRLKRIAAVCPTADDSLWLAKRCEALLRCPEDVRHIEDFVGLRRGRGMKTLATLIRERCQSNALRSYCEAIGSVEVAAAEASARRALSEFAEKANRRHKPKDAKERALAELLEAYRGKPPKSNGTFRRAAMRAKQMVRLRSSNEVVETSPHEL